MEDHPGEQDDIDFSIITPGNDKQKQLDFSVHELLQNPKQKSNSQKHISTEQHNKKQEIIDGSFMKDLQKMQKQISYETIPYDVYQPEEPGQFTGTFEAKQEDTCTRTTNNMTKLCQKNMQNDFKHLIVDFTQEKSHKAKSKQNFEDYFEVDILTTKKINDKAQQGSHKTKVYSSNEKNSKSKYNSSKQMHFAKPKLQNRVTELSNKKLSVNRINSNILSNRKKSKISSSQSKQQSQKSITKTSSKKPEKKVCKNSTRLQSQVYSEYYGFEQVDQPKKSKGSKKSVSKGKKIVYSNKNVNLYH